MRLRRRLRSWLLSLLGVSVALCILLNHWVINNTEAYVYSDWALLPDNDVGLVLGTSSLTRHGSPNPQFYGRIRAAVELYQIGKIKRIIVSGANPDSNYNEPRSMWRELTKAGIPSSAITMDFAGFRTFDSIYRAQAVFGLNRLTIITQRYHAYRGVFIGKKLQMQVVAYAAPSDNAVPLQQIAREWFARIKAIFDIYLLETEPKFVGTPQPINSPDSGN